MTTSLPQTLDDLRSISDPVTRGKAARVYIDQRQEAINAALVIRDEAIREVLARPTGPSQTARLFGVSLSTIKVAKGRS